MTKKDYGCSSYNVDLEPCDQERLILGRRIGTLGTMMMLIGMTGMIASAGQISWDIARSFYLVVLAIGVIGTISGQKILRPLMKKYLRQFTFIA